MVLTPLNADHGPGYHQSVHLHVSELYSPLKLDNDIAVKLLKVTININNPTRK